MMMGSMCLFFSVAFLFSTIKTTTTNKITTKTNFYSSFFVFICYKWNDFRPGSLHTSLGCVSKYLLRSLNFIRRQSSVIEVVRAHARTHTHTRSHSTISSSRSLIISLFAYFMSICALLTIQPICVRFGSFHVLFQCFIYYYSYNASSPSSSLSTDISVFLRPFRVAVVVVVLPSTLQLHVSRWANIKCM